jgi:bifunctional DNA-binding transcriptional regulator/antitoxin component of YhaV-PrlF toxin-antitoxin module
VKHDTIIRAKTGMFCFFVSPAQLKAVQNEKRAVCEIGGIEFHCALNRNKQGEVYIYVNKQILKRLGLKEGDSVKAHIRKDNSSYQFKFPLEFKEVLKTDPDASVIFEKLPDGTKRGLLYLIERMKTTDKRIEKSLIVASFLKQGLTSAREIVKGKK